jgi:hypothetical protein
MKNQLVFIFVSLLVSVTALAQPAYDNCNSPFDLGFIPFCNPTIIFNNTNATSSVVSPDAIPYCFVDGMTDRDVWISFNASLDPNNLDYTITLQSYNDGINQPILNPQIALYYGECADEMNEIQCVQAQLGTGEVQMNVLGLVPGFQYFLRINDYTPPLSSSTPNAGAFTLCLSEYIPPILLSNGSTNANFGTICDDGGPNNNYSNDADYLYEICPSGDLNCFIFELEYYNIDAGIEAEELLIWEGDLDEVENGTPTLLGEISMVDLIPISWGAASQTYYTSQLCITL